MGDELKRVLTQPIVLKMAGAAAFEKGLNYYRQGRVLNLEAEAGSIEGVVAGRENYLVCLKLAKGAVDYDCDCFEGAVGNFCKHCVAVALAWFDTLEPKRVTQPKEATLEDAERLLSTESKAELVHLILGWAEQNPRLKEQMLQYSARRMGPDRGIASAKKAFDTAVGTHGFVHYREVGDWAQNVEHAIDNFAELLEDGYHDAVVALCESALKKLEAAAGEVDDSDGYISGLAGRLQELHLLGCERGEPDAVALARRLFDWELNGSFDFFHDAVTRYAKVLGEKGLMQYRKLCEAEWETVPEANSESLETDWLKHRRITRIMESLARVSGDVEALVSVLSRDLSSSYNYLRIAEAYLEYGHPDKALVWAEKGLKEFPSSGDGRLREFTAGLYHNLDRHDDALSLMWAAFLSRPNLETYQTLARHAKIAGTWPELREKALSKIVSLIGSFGDRSLLVAIYLQEGNPEAAWDEAQRGGCSERLWYQLAEAREISHPADAAPIYLKHAEEAANTTKNGRYHEAVDLLVKAAAAMNRLGSSEEFECILANFRNQYKRKKNLIKLIEQNRTVLYLR